MRVRAALGAIALAGTVLLGGAAQAMADDNDDMGNVGVESGSSAPATSDADQGMSGMDQDMPEFGKVGGIFDRQFGH
ncbi:hypothetical protein [Streptomyces sp. NPDC049099]|uniref:hypothetical protein n=1 Tax=unclassified Streptomyces TaxID=2593676 RepID=UPI0034317146